MHSLLVYGFVVLSVHIIITQIYKYLLVKLIFRCTTADFHS